MDDGALINGMIRINHLGGGEPEQRVNGDEYHTNGVGVNRTPPLKVVVGSD